MHIGFIGLGRMGMNMVLRLARSGHDIICWSSHINDGSHRETRAALEKDGAKIASSVAQLIAALPSPKVVWLMVPAGAPVDDLIAQIAPQLQKGDIIVDGGNSHYKDSVRRAKSLEPTGIRFLDVGTSGGIWGLKNGYCIMAGGEESAFKIIEPAIATLAPEEGYLYCGAAGAGHFVKMIHNGIEYGMMEAYAEGFEILQKSPYKPDMQKVSHIWNHGSVVRSWLLELAEDAFAKDPQLAQIEDYVDDSGEGRWTVEAAVDFDVPATVLTHALMARFRSRQDSSFAGRLLAALRNEFGGHAVKKADT